MAVCTFFGHRDCPSSVKPGLRDALIYLIEHGGVDMFYVGNHGAFDAMVRLQLSELSQRYPHISYEVVLAYLPRERGKVDNRDFLDTMFPEGIETVPKRFAISWRNRWMLMQSDYVVTYITHSWGSAAQLAEKAIKARKLVRNLAVDSQIDCISHCNISDNTL